MQRRRQLYKSPDDDYFELPKKPLRLFIINTEHNLLSPLPPYPLPPASNLASFLFFQV